MSNSVAIVTGASQGIGRATAIRLARDFSALVLVARGRANLEETAEAVKAAGAEALVIDSDLADPSVPQIVVDRALAAFGRTYLSAGAGYIAHATGWVWFFVICALAGLPALALLGWLQRRRHFDGLGPADTPAPAPLSEPAKESAAS